jgi:hypothetical protein
MHYTCYCCLQLRPASCCNFRPAQNNMVSRPTLILTSVTTSLNARTARSAWRSVGTDCCMTAKPACMNIATTTGPWTAAHGRPIVRRLLHTLCLVCCFHSRCPLFFRLAQQSIVGQGPLTIEASRSHSGTPHSVGLLWTDAYPVAETT